MAPNNFSLLVHLTKTELIRKHTGTVGGMAYTVLAPMMLIGVIWIALDYGLGLRATLGPGFGIQLIIGLTLWLAFFDAVGDATTAITRNPHFVRKMVFPVELLPFTSVTAAFSVHILVLLFVSGGLFWAGHINLVQIWILPFGFILAVIFASGIAILIAGLAVIIRDVQIIAPIILSIWFWITPIIWQVERVPEKWLWIFALNPMAIAIEAYRSALLGTIYPFDIMIVLAGCFITVLTLCLGQLLFSILRSSFADNL